MNWNAVAAIAELLAAVGVLASLLYLASQVKQNTRVNLSIARQGIANLAVAGGALFAESGEVAELLHRAFTGKNVDGPGELRLQATCYMLMRQYENIEYQNGLGMLTAGEWKGFRENLKLFYATDLFRKYWVQDKPLFSPVFREEVDSVIAELDAAGEERSILMEELPESRLPGPSPDS